MAAFLASFALFVALHSIPAIPAIRGRLMARLGRASYFTGYSLVSLLALYLVFRTGFSLDYIPLWDPAPWQARVTLLTAPIGLFLVAAGLISRNPFSITLLPDNGTAGAIVSVTRHPVLVGFFVWAAGHLVPNGDMRSVILFGLLALFSLGGIAMQERRARRRLGTRFDAERRFTSILPLAALAAGRARPHVDGAFLYGLLLAALVTFLLLAGWHELLIGVDPLALATAG